MKLRGLLASVTAAMSLGGCAAALIPVVAGGAIGRKVVRHHAAMPSPQPESASSTVAPPPAVAVSTPPPVVAPLTAPTAAPVQPSSAASPPSPAPPTRVRSVAPVATWDDVLHYIVVGSDPSGDSVLLTRHVPGGAQRAVPCGAKPLAVIVDVATNPDGSGDSYIDALRTLKYAVVFTSARPRAEEPYLAAPAAPSHQLLRGDMFVQLVPGAEGAARATVASRYCVIAIVGQTAADFPDGLMPGTKGASHGWFAVAAP